MAIEHHGHEHEFEPQFGLPERLPAGERILWQGSPQAGALAVSAFHLRKLALYFALLVAWQGWGGLQDEAWTAGSLIAHMAWPLGLSLLGLGAVGLLAWLTARTAVYTLTDRRVVMRIGIVLTLSFNLPLSKVASASMRRVAGGCGDIVLSLQGQDRIAYLHLWPHARAWRLARTEPTLRSVAQPEAVAHALTQAWAAAHAAAPAGVNSAAPPRREAATVGGREASATQPAHAPSSGSGARPLQAQPS